MCARFLRPHHPAMHPALCVLFPSCSAQHPPLACALLVPVHLNVPRHHCWKRDKRSRSLRAENSLCKIWQSKPSRTMAPAQMRPDMLLSSGLHTRKSYFRVSRVPALFKGESVPLHDEHKEYKYIYIYIYMEVCMRIGHCLNDLQTLLQHKFLTKT